jgi:hypothetical protein
MYYYAEQFFLYFLKSQHQKEHMRQDMASVPHAVQCVDVRNHGVPMEGLAAGIYAFFRVERFGRDYTLCGEKDDVNDQIEQREVLHLVNDPGVEQFNHTGAYAHSNAFDHQDGQHGFPETRTISCDGGDRLGIVKNHTDRNKQSHTQQKVEYLHASVIFHLAHDAACTHFILYNRHNTDILRGSYVTLYMNPDTMDFKQSMFIPNTTSAIGKLCPNQRRVPQLVRSPLLTHCFISILDTLVPHDRGR